MWLRYLSCCSEDDNQEGQMNIKDRIFELRKAYHDTYRKWPTEVVLPLEDLEEIENRLGKAAVTVFKMRIVEGSKQEVR